MRSVLFFLSWLLAMRANAQTIGMNEVVVDSTVQYQFSLDDGSRFTGSVVAMDLESFTIRTSSAGDVRMLKKNVEKVMKLDMSLTTFGRHWFPNPHGTRYLLGPSAIPLEKGEGYYQNTYLFLNSVQVGVSKNVSIGGGIELLTTFSVNGPGPIFFLTAKSGFKVARDLHLGAGGLYLSIPDFSFDGTKDRVAVGALYGQATYGNRERQITGSLGWGYSADGLARRPMPTLAGLVRIGGKAAFITENWFIPTERSYYTLISYGIRFMGESIAVDVAFLNNGDIVQVIAIGIPWIDLVVKF